MKALLLSICLVWSCVPALAGKVVPLQSARVISQEIGSYNNGAAVVPYGNMLFAAPIRRQSNIVVVETARHRLTWSESPRDRHTLVLSVNDTIQFYYDGKWFIVLDSKHKKHKFALVHMETIEAEK
ncbi:MAG: hypothetical protein RB191_04130 [Terriglobia bacterium]|nr:hypothetical protein [Terriglobia bacterium]